MIRRRRAEPCGQPETSIWATDDIEITAAPTQFEWASVGTGRTGDRHGESGSTATDPSPSPRGWIAAVAIAAAVAAMVTVVFWPDDGVDDEFDPPG